MVMRIPEAINRRVVIHAAVVLGVGHLARPVAGGGDAVLG